MSVVSVAGNGRITVPDIQNRKQRISPNPSSAPIQQSSDKKRITCLTAYDFPSAKLVDEAGVDIILVGDSLGMVVLGHENTVPVTMEDMLHHTRAVHRGVKHALLVADMPYGSYHTGVGAALTNALRLVKEG